MIMVVLLGASVPHAHAAASRDHQLQAAELHRNPGRGQTYLPRAVADGTTEPATFGFAVRAKWPLTIDPTENVRAAVYPIDAFGDGSLELLQLEGYRFLRLFTQTGSMPWSLRNQRGRIHRSVVHRDTAAILDVDGDRRQEVVHCWLDGAGKKTLVVRSAVTGAVLRSVSLAGDGAASECQIAAFRVEGRAEPIILVARQVRLPGSRCTRINVDEWAVTEAYDPRLNLLWRRDTCQAGHYVWPLDEDQDGFAEALLVGKYLIDPSGGLRCTLAGWEKDHVDSAVLADLDLGRPGAEIVTVGSTGTRTYSAAGCKPIATVSVGTIVNPQVVQAVRLSAADRTPSIVIRSRPSERVPYVYRIDIQGRVLSRYVDTNPRHQQPMMAGNLDGAQAAEDLVTAFGQVVDGSGRLRLDTSWYWGLGSLTSAEQALSPYDQWTSAPLVVDLDGDGRDEIVTWGRRVMVIGTRH